MIFDTAAGEVSPQVFGQIIAPQLKKLTRPEVGYYLKNGTEVHLDLVPAGFLGLGVDHTFDMPKLLKRDRKKFIQGNFDQHFLTLDSGDFRKALATYLRPLLDLTAFERRGWIAGLGHGITPLAREENVRHYVQLVRLAFGN